MILLSYGYVVAEGEIKPFATRVRTTDADPHPVPRGRRPSRRSIFENEHVVEARLHSDGAGLLVKDSLLRSVSTWR